MWKSTIKYGQDFYGKINFFSVKSTCLLKSWFHEIFLLFQTVKPDLHGGISTTEFNVISRFFYVKSFNSIRLDKYYQFDEFLCWIICGNACAKYGKRRNYLSMKKTRQINSSVTSLVESLLSRIFLNKE